MARKISRSDAMKRINEMLEGYEVRERDNRYGGCKKYYLMKEDEFNAFFEKVLESSTKDLRKYLEMYSDRKCIVDEGITGCAIRTWSVVYAVVVLIH